MMSEGVLTRYFDLPPGKWRINCSMPGFKVVAVATEGLRHRLFSDRRLHRLAVLVVQRHQRGKLRRLDLSKRCGAVFRRCTSTSERPSTCGRCRCTLGG